MKTRRYQGQKSHAERRETRIPTPVQFGHSSSQPAAANGKALWRREGGRSREKDTLLSAFYPSSTDEAGVNGDWVKHRLCISTQKLKKKNTIL